MASQTMAARPEPTLSDVSTETRSQPWYEAQFRALQASSGKAINLDSLNKTADEVKNLALVNKLSDYDEVTEKVVCRLSALTDFFMYFELTEEKTGHRIKSIPGLYYILDDCIDDLEGLKK
jgi:hypothetical protein